jgi:integrase
MWKAFQRACKEIKIAGLRPYDFRHSMLTAVYAETRDLRVTGMFGGQRTERTVKRYTIAAVAPHVLAARDRVAARLAGHQSGHHGLDDSQKSGQIVADSAETPSAQNAPENP